MKIRRHKKVHKNLNFYVNNFSFRQPYQILIDGTICLTALNNKINLADNLPKYLQAELKLLTTQCAFLETEKLGHKVFGALQILKQFSVHKCGHEGKPIQGANCLLSMIGKNNQNHYMIATQDLDLQSKLRLRPGVPLIYLHNKTPVFEQPSQASITHVENQAPLGTIEKETIAKLKEESGIQQEPVKPSKKKKRKKGPNPLSCKKKKKKVGNSQSDKVKLTESGNIQKVKRKKIRIAKHVKEEILKSVNK